MQVKVSTVILSHLSDASLELAIGRNQLAHTRLGFVKWLVTIYPNTDTLFDPDQAYACYQDTLEPGTK